MPCFAMRPGHTCTRSDEKPGFAAASGRFGEESFFRLHSSPFGGADSEQPVHEASPEPDRALRAEFVTAVAPYAKFIVYQRDLGLAARDSDRPLRAGIAANAASDALSLHHPRPLRKPVL